VTINGSLADRKVEYFHREIAVANGSSPVWQSVTSSSGTSTNKGGLLAPASSQVLTYDADGNLSSDSIWTYQWDGENRLISMAMNANVANIVATNRLQLQFTYDYMGRRVEKKVSHWNSGSWILDSDSLFVYDGWNLLAEVGTSGSLVRDYVWGLDLSGTMTGAGGVGGLLMTSISGTNCFAAYDGNGNITALINATDKSLAARYEYSPYGELIRSTGLMARQNPFRFSTKYWDDESGLVYYNYRYYSPSIGRWISRDPSGESGGINLLGFVGNRPINVFDRNGKDWVGNTITVLELVNQILEALSSGNPFGALNPFSVPVTADLEVILMESKRAVMALNIGNAIIQQLNAQQASYQIVGTAIGQVAKTINATGGNGDDLILDASLAAAGSTGVDAAEGIYGVATDVEDQ